MGGRIQFRNISLLSETWTWSYRSWSISVCKARTWFQFNELSFNSSNIVRP